AVGVFPDLPWARAILPSGYPFFYGSSVEAESLLLRAVTAPEACRRELDGAAEGDFSSWLRGRHDDDHFERTIADQVTGWFGCARALALRPRECRGGHSEFMIERPWWRRFAAVGTVMTGLGVALLALPDAPVAVVVALASVGLVVAGLGRIAGVRDAGP